METAVLIFILAISMIWAFMTGLWFGQNRNLSRKQEKKQDMAGEASEYGDRAAGSFEEENESEGVIQKRSGEEKKRHKNDERVIAGGKAIGSPCDGEVNFFYEGNRRGAVLLPSQGQVYAPASGKIIRLYPMGNAFVLRTDFGVELLLKAGSRKDELLSMYYRARVVQNEIVNKGRLLLEFDLEGLLAEGEDTAVSVSVEAADDYRDILITNQKHVKVGEELLWVKEKEG